MEGIDDEVFRGGMHEVRRVGHVIQRPAGPHTRTVQRLLRHVRERGFLDAPQPIDLDQQRRIETVSFLPGATTNYPLRGLFRSDRALDSAARLLRRLHDASSDFRVTDDDVWYLEARAPVEVICHGDFAPYNCAFDHGGTVTGVFDFDTAHPGPRVWDLAYAAYRWVPLTTSPLDVTGLGEQRRRLLQFCTTYGFHDLDGVVRTAVERLQALVDFMLTRAAAGDAAFANHIDAGHADLYRADMMHLIEHRRALIAP